MKVPSRYWTLLRDSLSTTRFSDNSLRLTLLAIQTSIFYQAKGIFLYYTKQPKLETDSYLPTVSFRSVINEWMLRRSSANSWKKWRSVKLSFWASNTRSAGTNCLYYSTFPSPALSPTFVGNFKTKSMVLNDSFKISLLLISNTDISLNLCRDTQTLVKNRVKQRLTLKRESRLVHKLFFLSESKQITKHTTDKWNYTWSAIILSDFHNEFVISLSFFELQLTASPNVKYTMSLDPAAHAIIWINPDRHNKRKCCSTLIMLF